MAQRPGIISLVLDIARHALPLVSLYALHGSAETFLLLTAFNLALGLMLIVGTTRDRGDVTTVDPRSRWLIMRWIAVAFNAAFLAFIAGFIMLPIVFPALILGARADVDWSVVIAQKSVWIPVIGMSLLASARFQDLFEERTTTGPKGQPSRVNPVVGDLESDRKRSLADYAAQVTLIAAYVFVCFVLIEFGGWGLYAFPPLYTLMLIFFDARPDLGRRIFPQLWQRK
jgi:hypothetical protein